MLAHVRTSRLEGAQLLFLGGLWALMREWEVPYFQLSDTTEDKLQLVQHSSWHVSQDPSLYNSSCLARLNPHPTLTPCSPSNIILQVLQPRGFPLLCLGKGFPSSWNMLFLLFSLEIPISPPRLNLTVTFSVHVLHDLFPLQTPKLRSLHGLWSLLSLAFILVIQTITLCYNFIFAYLFLSHQYYEQLENKYLVLKFMHVT